MPTPFTTPPSKLPYKGISMYCEKFGAKIPPDLGKFVANVNLWAKMDEDLGQAAAGGQELDLLAYGEQLAGDYWRRQKERLDKEAAARATT